MISTINIPNDVCWPILHLIKNLAKINTDDPHGCGQDAKAEHHYGHDGSKTQESVVKKQLSKNEIEREGKT